jgi:enoyl-CoA hydratase/carnithine racemase
MSTSEPSLTSAAATETILCARNRRDDGTIFAEITLNRPDKGNALTMPMLVRMSDIVRDIEVDREIRAVVIRGRGRYFCTGGDIAAWGALTPRQMAREWIIPGIQVLSAISALPVPVIAVLSGHAIGGGLELAMAADLRIAHRDVQCSMPEVGLGMVAGWGGVRRLSELIGIARARHMALLGVPITASQALEWGLVTAVANDDAGVNAQVDTWLARLCNNSPAGIALTKGILATMHADLREHHAAVAAEAAATDDCREGVRAFLEKRKPVFPNR